MYDLDAYGLRRQETRCEQSTKNHSGFGHQFRQQQKPQQSGGFSKALKLLFHCGVKCGVDSSV